jgi:hypothetical protein
LTQLAEKPPPDLAILAMRANSCRRYSRSCDGCFEEKISGVTYFLNLKKTTMIEETMFLCSLLHPFMCCKIMPLVVWIDVL